MAVLLHEMRKHCSLSFEYSFYNNLFVFVFHISYITSDAAKPKLLQHKNKFFIRIKPHKNTKAIIDIFLYPGGITNLLNKNCRIHIWILRIRNISIKCYSLLKNTKGNKSKDSKKCSKFTSGDCNIFQQATSNITKNEIIYFKTKNYVRFYYHSAYSGYCNPGHL